MISEKSTNFCFKISQEIHISSIFINRYWIVGCLEPSLGINGFTEINVFQNTPGVYTSC